jgi:hypothetical protein
LINKGDKKYFLAYWKRWNGEKKVRSGEVK